MKKIADLTGQQFSFLTVLKEAPRRGKFRYWFCQCTCGTQNEVLQSALIRGSATTCGCRDGKTPQNMIGMVVGKWTIIEPDIIKLPKLYYICKCECGILKSVSKANLRQGTTSSCMSCRKTSNGGTTHGLSKHRLYSVWCGMKERCNNTNSPDYKNYGGRGITVCERWNYFPNFAEDMDSTYQHNLTIERINTNDNYNPTNCIWIPKSEQSKNRRSVHQIEYRGKIYTQVELIKMSGLPRGTIEGRMKLGWTIEKVVNGKTK